MRLFDAIRRLERAESRRDSCARIIADLVSAGETVDSTRIAMFDEAVAAVNAEVRNVEDCLAIRKDNS